MIDKEKLVQSLTPNDIIEIVEELGCDDYIEKEREIIFPTFCHHVNPDDGSHKLYYYKKDHRFYCYTCCGAFDIIGLMCRRYQLLDIKYDFYKDVLVKLAEKSSISVMKTMPSFVDSYESITDKYRSKNVDIVMPPLDSSILNSFIYYPTSEWLNDGIGEKAMQLYGIKYSISDNKIIIPHYNNKGNLVGIRGRALNEDEQDNKYMPVAINGKIYSHPLGYNLYGLNMVAGNIKRLGMAIITEAEKSVLQYDTMFGHHDNICVATCGSSLHDYQINLLLYAGARKILLAYDKEGGTPAEAEKYYSKLNHICSYYKNKVQIGYIQDMENLLDLKDSPTDKGRETFLRLYWKNTVWL